MLYLNKTPCPYNIYKDIHISHIKQTVISKIYKIFSERYMDESGPFLPSFLLSSDDVSSPLDNSSLAAYESGTLTTTLFTH